MRPGRTPEGERYDGAMRNITCNHLALVSTPRIGPAGYLADRLPDWRIEERFFDEFRRAYILGAV
jgi:uncharacterized protein